MASRIPSMNDASPFSTMLWDRYTAPQTAPADQSPSGSGMDSADVAKTAALLKAIVETANSIPAVDQARVASLQQAVVSGSVHADPQQIAQSFTALEALLV